MAIGPRPQSIDTGTVFRVYAGVTLVTGLLVYSWPAALLPRAAIPAGFPGSEWAVTRLGAALAVAAGACATGLGTLVEPMARRRALGAFAIAHLSFGALFFIQWHAIFDNALPPLVGWAPLLAGGILLYAADFGRSHGAIRRLSISPDPNDPYARKSVTLDVRSRTVDALRSQYEKHIQQVARQEERTRLARDLHDAVKQQLFVIQTAAATIHARFETDAAGAREALGHVRAAAREAMGEMEAMIEQLQATPLENTSLVEALRRQCEALGFRTGAEVTFDAGALPPAGILPPGTQQNLFRAAQEALANIGRHARATHVAVRLGTTGKDLELTIKDDGVGFDPLSTAAGMGLTNMGARAEEMSGSFRLSSGPGNGTTVRVLVPLGQTSPAKKAVQAAVWAALLGACGLYLRAQGVSEHPWAVAFAVVSGIAMVRHLSAYRHLRKAWAPA
jgi:signal transduction histidine kinase